jgi:hypothetical protein
VVAVEIGISTHLIVDPVLVVAAVLLLAAVLVALDRHLATQDLVLVVAQRVLEMVEVELLLFDILVVKPLLAVV